MENNHFFKNKTILITGGSKNLGRAIGIAFSQLGGNVAINARNDSEELKETIQLISNHQGKAIPYIADITDHSSVSDMFKKIDSDFGGVDILINNAVTHAGKPFLDLSFQEWEKTISVTLHGSFFCTQYSAPMMIKKGGGSIINMGGMFGHLPIPNRSPSSAAKAGIAGMTRALALEFAQYNINVNYLAPGPANTIRDPNIPFQFDLKKIPFGRFTEPSEIVNMVLLLCGKEGRYITGQSIHVNGGVFMNN